MKKLILFSLFLVAGVAGANAQTETETLVVKAARNGEGPKAVMDAIKQDFPKSIVTDLNMLPGKLYGEQWSVSSDNELNGAQPDIYVVNLKEGNETFKAVYDNAGNMKSSKHVIPQAQLPSEVTSTIASKYPGWTVIKDSEKITYQEGTIRDVYKVDIQKDKTRRSLFLNDAGVLVKDVHLKHSK